MKAAGEAEAGMQECNLPRNNRLRLIEMVNGRERRSYLVRSLRSPPDDRSPMPQKTHGGWSLLFRLR
jgi:hypothetical protein